MYKNIGHIYLLSEFIIITYTTEIIFSKQITNIENINCKAMIISDTKQDGTKLYERLDNEKS